MKSTIIITLILSSLFSCSKTENKGNEFPEEIHLANPKTAINKDYLGRIEGIQSNDSLLITWDYHSGTSFTLFNNKTGKCYDSGILVKDQQKYLYPVEDISLMDNIKSSVAQLDL